MNYLKISKFCFQEAKYSKNAKDKEEFIEEAIKQQLKAFGTGKISKEEEVFQTEILNREIHNCSIAFKKEVLKCFENTAKPFEKLNVVMSGQNGESQDRFDISTLEIKKFNKVMWEDIILNSDLKVKSLCKI